MRQASWLWDADSTRTLRQGKRHATQIAVIHARVNARIPERLGIVSCEISVRAATKTLPTIRGLTVKTEQVKPYIWPHIDFGNSQVCAKFLGELNHKHGTIVEFESDFDFRGLGMKAAHQPIKYKGIFRILDAGLYCDEWMREALPIAKQLYEDGARP